MRKLPVLCYALWKTDRVYDPDYPTAQLVGQAIAPVTEVGRDYAE
ncbi:hypothetical protein [Hymenobacter rigui]|nr:hypothetical protein [Hymenobacter rigui]